MAKKRKNGGRPSKYETNVKPYLKQIEQWVRNGLTEEEIAKKCNVAYSTFREYKKQFSALADALKSNRELADLEVEASLFKRATGYEYDEVTKELIDGELVVTKVVTKQMAPDTTAQIYWLKNRLPHIYRDRHEINHTGSMDINNPLKDVPTSDLKNLIASLTSDNR